MAKAKHTIRIISGTHRNRRLPILDIDGLRPTGERVRETLFNWLQMDIAGKNVLDLCSGSGALAFEAASRGADSVTMVELNKEASLQLIQNTKTLKFENLKVLNTSAQKFLANCDRKFDIVFIDPPFALNLFDELTQLAVPFVSINGFIYRESANSAKLQVLDENWELYRQKKMGQVKIELWKKLAE